MIDLEGAGEDNRDIWMMKKLPTGAWAKIQPLPPSVNTIYDEESPYLHPDGKTLYFSSKGHNSMGGYDVFKTELLEDGSWSEVTNLGIQLIQQVMTCFTFLLLMEKELIFLRLEMEGKENRIFIY